MAEQANAAVESMKQQIDRLVESVGEFKLAGAAKRGVSRSARPASAPERGEAGGSRSPRRAA